MSAPGAIPIIWGVAPEVSAFAFPRSKRAHVYDAWCCSAWMGHTAETTCFCDSVQVGQVFKLLRVQAQLYAAESKHLLEASLSTQRSHTWWVCACRMCCPGRDLHALCAGDADADERLVVIAISRRNLGIRYARTAGQRAAGGVARIRTRQHRRISQCIAFLVLET